MIERRIFVRAEAQSDIKEISRWYGALTVKYYDLSTLKCPKEECAATLKRPERSALG